jgi:putative transposase
MAELPSLRVPRIFEAVREAVGAASKGNFQVVQFSVQRDHLHLVVEADDKAALSSGVNGLAVRCAKAVNRAVGRRGRVWGDRYDGKAKDSPTLMRHLLIYVLFNAKKHIPGSAEDIDPCSSAPWFGGFRERIARSTAPSPVRAPRTWLADVGWMKAGGLISIHDAPAGYA